MSTIAGVVRAEGVGSAIRRTGERISEASRLWLRLASGMIVRTGRVPLLNVLAMQPSPRLGGVPIQFNARIREERALREVAILYPGILEAGSRAWRAPAFAATSERFDVRFERAVAYAIARTGARAVVIEGMSGIPVGSVLRLAEEGVEVIVSVHDYSLLSSDPHVVEARDGAPDAEVERRAAARQLLERARAVIFPSNFLRDRYQELLSLPELISHVIEPGIPGGAMACSMGTRGRIAFVGSVKRHKGGHLIPEIIGAFAQHAEIEWHVFGGGDESLLKAIRSLPRVVVHGYYRAGALPSLLVQHAIGLALLPSIVPESYGLTLSECWQAGVPAVAFSLGAYAERIGREGGGKLVPVEEGATGVAGVVARWLNGEIGSSMPATLATSAAAAVAHAALYRTV